jgi:probable H4MPT-linked C1 transfer pathway protein
VDDAIIGWDIGGAHVKAVKRGRCGPIERVVHRPCALWQGLAVLEAVVDRVCDDLAARCCRNRLTMTGELADIFPDRATGVRHIVAIMLERVPAERLRVFAGRAGWVSPEVADHHIMDIASANWYATVTLAARSHRDGLLVDIGSTTSDIVGFAGGLPANQSYTDAERLGSGELLYTGVVRTPVCAMVDRVPLAGDWHGLAAEVFATAGDAHVLAGRLTIDSRFGPAADGGEFTAEGCARRLARMVGRDLDGADLSAWRALARYIVQAQVDSLRQAVERRLSAFTIANPLTLVGAGIGRAVAREIAARLGLHYVDFAELLQSEEAQRTMAADCAPAAALTFLD